MLVGLWPAEDEILKDEKLRAIVGADYYVASLREGVMCCMKAATGVSPKAAATTAVEVKRSSVSEAARVQLPA